MDKAALRIWAKDLRKDLPIKAVSVKLANLLKSEDLYINAKNVMLFYPKKYEINLLSLLEGSKNFYLPRVEGEDIVVCPYQKGDILQTSSFKVYEPCSKAVSADILDLVIVPALAADKNGCRLGYGKGFYDRFLSQNPGKYKTITLLPKELVIEKLPTEKCDIKIDKIITI